jgi:NAD(P)-dependent dehydrogenase (short-subunit alcohol dehydrogenase family)
MLGFATAAVAGSLAACSHSHPAVSAAPARRRFEGKSVLITGATSGIGRAAALAFAAEGGKVGFCGRRENLGHEVEREIRSRGGEAIYIRADIRRESDVQSFVDQVAKHHAGIDVAFNNAGITLEKPLHEYTSQEWDDVVNTNLRGVFLAMKYDKPQRTAVPTAQIHCATPSPDARWAITAETSVMANPA